MVIPMDGSLRAKAAAVGQGRTQLSEKARVPGRLPGTLMVEAGGQCIRSFRCGLDYAFNLMTAFGLQVAERVMPQLHRDILVPAQKRKASSASL